MKQVIVFPRGQLTEKDKRAIARAGCVVVEADDPSKVVAAIPTVPLVSSDELLTALLKAASECSYATNIGEKLLKNLSEVAKRKAQQD